VAPQTSDNPENSSPEAGQRNTESNNFAGSVENFIQGEIFADIFPDMPALKTKKSLKKEQEELVVIEQYLPPSMSEQDLIAALKDIIASTGASSMKDIGKVMPVAMKSLAGKTDGKAINDALKTLLS
jgi:Glu-tRNA(Gln) amidotransferase subunit E-like FAD-binding protein